jgi:hypothetical protein
MHCRRSLNLEPTPFDPEIQRTFRSRLRTQSGLVNFVEMGDNIENVAETRTTLRELFSPITTNPPSCRVLPATTAAHFELKPHIIQLLPSFHGFDHEDPYQHVKDFLEICSTFSFQNFSDESVRLRLFPFS